MFKLSISNNQEKDSFELRRMNRYLVEISIVGHFCNWFGNYIIAESEEKALKLADVLMRELSGNNLKLSDFTYRIKQIEREDLL